MSEQEYQITGHYMVIIEKVGKCYIEHFLKQRGIARSLVPFLLELHHTDGVTQESLSKTMMLDKSTVARTISKLEKQGMIRRVQNEEDRRENLVYLTDKGKKVFPLIKDLRVAWQKEIMEELTGQEKEQFITVLEKMATKAKLYSKYHG